MSDTKKELDERAERYDSYYEKFEGAVEHHVDWEVLKEHLPMNRDAKILDAAGGTGRIALPVAKMGYSVSLCDISPGMLKVAKRKLSGAGVLNKVELTECDIHKLPYADESFDFTIGWHGMFEAVKELIRVTKKGGMMSVFLVNRCGDALSKFHEDPDAALDLLSSKSNTVTYNAEKYLAVNVDEARELFEKEGIRVIDVRALFGMLEFLSIPEKTRESGQWDETFFKQTCEMALCMSKEPSLKGLSRHLGVYGERIR
ncbi:methyltransferase domain-containing protein [bacterium]|nr:methyltransferase domain-containing protein [bacterium]